MDQLELEGNTHNRRQARENACEQVTIAFDFLFHKFFIGWESGANFANQSQSEVKQKPSKREITFDIHLKIAL